MPHLLFISTHNLATNPRLVKEIELALSHHYKVTLLCCSFDNWSAANNERLKEFLLPNIEYIEVSGTRKPFVPWLLSSIIFQLAGFILKWMPNHIYWLSVRSNKRSWLLMQALKKINSSIDAVIAHNPGSFYPAKFFAQKNKIPYGIDLEDYHAGETNDPAMQVVFKRLQQHILPQAWYVSAASRLIRDYANADLSSPLPAVLEVLNFFEGAEFVSPAPKENNQLQLVWFSQNIAAGRGLEEILPIVKNNQQLVLHLYGYLQEDFYRSQLAGIPNIFIHAAMPQALLHKELSKYDVGLALEKPGSNLNRDLCITNKILAYQQAGLYIMASHTKAQDAFIHSNPSIGVLTALDEKSLQQTIQNIHQHITTIRYKALERFQNAQSTNWASESAKLLQQWKQIKH